MSDGQDTTPEDGPPQPSETEHPLPPGQLIQEKLTVRHYGPVPKVRDAGAWAMSFAGRTETGEDHQLTVAELAEMPQARVVADLHCAGKWSTTDNAWEGVLAKHVLERFPPAAGIVHVIAYGQYGYSANLKLEDLLGDQTLLATHLAGEPLTPEHGFPVRLIVPHLYSWKGPKWFRGWEYAPELRRGFWEERGYHVDADPWREERYSYQETHPIRAQPPTQRSGD
jgi:DMSO/TMAO reductase YedYZ molybdopterin-dependent catalytic subunit